MTRNGRGGPYGAITASRPGSLPGGGGARRGLRLRICLPILAVAAAALAGCSSSDSSDSSSDSSSDDASSAGGKSAGRAADACTMLTSDQVADVVGIPGAYTGAEEDAAQDGSPVWGCTWGTPSSYADVRETRDSIFTDLDSDGDLVTSPLSGIGDKAELVKVRSDGSQPYVYFVAGGRTYSLEIVRDRRELDATNAPAEASAGQKLAKDLAKRLAG